MEQTRQHPHRFPGSRRKLLDLLRTQTPEQIQQLPGSASSCVLPVIIIRHRRCSGGSINLQSLHWYHGISVQTINSSCDQQGAPKQPCSTTPTTVGVVVVVVLVVVRESCVAVRPTSVTHAPQMLLQPHTHHDASQRTNSAVTDK